MIEVTQGGKEGTFLDLHLLEVLLLERLLVKPPLGHVLVKDVIPIALVPTKVMVTRANLLLSLLGAASDEVVGVAAVE
jgi:hypothetical protein